MNADRSIQPVISSRYSNQFLRVPFTQTDAPVRAELITQSLALNFYLIDSLASIITDQIHCRSGAVHGVRSYSSAIRIQYR